MSDKLTEAEYTEFYLKDWNIDRDKNEMTVTFKFSDVDKLTYNEARFRFYDALDHAAKPFKGEVIRK